MTTAFENISAMIAWEMAAARSMISTSSSRSVSAQSVASGSAEASRAA